MKNNYIKHKKLFKNIFILRFDIILFFFLSKILFISVHIEKYSIS